MSENTLFDLPPPPESQGMKKLRLFCQFHRANPDVWRLFVKFTFELIGRGFTRGGAQMIAERIRWQTMVSTDDVDGLKINNDFNCWYSRMFHVAYPQHVGFFRIRRLRSMDRPASGGGARIDGPPVNEDDIMDTLAKLVGANGDDAT